ncbi:ATP-binding protein [Mucilaginibacter limnophilus]|uniref:ATP-binding protein n=1 Tax=Mucilaginibacter limnophilus TaxID=1932778 RepID=A0A3S2X0S0_9SPHI|nr:ATP-binding protein [Mucilaginibacter limnophilus]RVU02751.1 ATP-binding protein [Mucilaginibacter limnophilus]
MKTLFKVSAAITLALSISAASAQQHRVVKLWETPNKLAIPESVFPDGKILYVALINGKPWDKDGVGSIGKVSTEGKIIDTAWVTGLNSPKGMGKHGNILYVADMDEVVTIDIKKGAVISKIKIDGAENLNDITIDKKGAIYVTDSKLGKVFKLDGNKGMLYLEGLKGLNGIKAVDNDLYVLADAMYRVDPAKKLTKITTLENGGDGIEPIGNGDFLVTAWQGYLYYVKADGTKDILLDTHTANIQTADIGYDPSTKTIYVPTFFAKSVAAYTLQ